ncbi:MAG: septum formation inhibitor Maf [Flavobacteriales bacterium]|jgi:hypothetical protein|uniref:septum formation inhibitor Maf n=1 Tax=Candidatus Ulvibacter alkanivorans TaxID=2267620 RepID=UPI001B35319C|nr:septum formation inhibitor Maf [Candidatus Ulvibacter alkanivorans]MCH2488886.1 septum formation inhibitor Maf [Flavobacteriales bacterium]
MLRYCKVFTIVLLFALCAACGNSEETQTVSTPSDQEADAKAEKQRVLSEAFKQYWYSGEGEITSFKLSQERYGELRDGTAVTVFVTEDFLPEEQVKADTYSEENISVLKLNATKKFNTGLYPYSIMSSTFSPIQTQGHALKITNSVQEWCGQVYMQMNNRDDFELQVHSYFEGESNPSIQLQRTWLEDELWNLVRINPEELPTGEHMIIPSFEYFRLRHKDPKAHAALSSLKQGDSLSVYTITYTDLQRQLTLYFNSTFPYEIEKWEETIAGREGDTTRLKTTATKMHRIKSAYWEQNLNRHLVLRDSLGLN